ncbi:response regulator [Saccharomonospora xinjiangensis]|uniref:Response regulator containing a CheY-like receiver domain and an HTH DNA-binding domain n=1 Tax=Saccharomonospora xinjiangensis XJ-54 TaxID=882086 RepID=I0V1Q4_9PSEU|nr:response regulator transcription factor [Saccharomonospora xinjiangensis]EID54057.1 response regulator containing a CheY-like receiver domain and an HTH DNA-binding domain [Saccharomonospora xinjiangensis XJ-54]
MPLRVVLVDDDPLVRTGLAMILDSTPEIEVVGQASDGDEAVPLVNRHAPDVVVMDIRMSRMDGLAATAAVRALARPPKVLVLTTFDLDEYVFDALTAGANGFLLKESSPQEIIDAVRVVARGESMLSPRSTTQLIGHFVSLKANPRRREAAVKLSTLTDREREVVTAVAQGKSNAGIAEELYMSEATVKTHITRTFAKLDVTNRVQLTIFAYEAGLVTP